MGNRHKHADVAIAFAEGKAVQVKDANGEWQDWDHCVFPAFHNDQDWRIKPAEPVVRWQWIYKPIGDLHWRKTSAFLTDAEAADNYFYPTTKRFKDEASRVEFPAEDNT